MLKKIIAFCACFIAVSLQAYGEGVKCKCNEVPFEPDPPCARACITSIMVYSDFNQLVESANLNSYEQWTINEYRREKTTDGIRSNGPGVSFSVLREVEVKLYSLPNDRLREIAKSLPDRRITKFIPSDKVGTYEFDETIKNNRE